jgi:mannose-6-phosphate isomerase-like protein (cupin superfamily)
MSRIIGSAARRLGGIACLGASVACSSTVPDTKYPPPPPSDGLPYIPFPEQDEFAFGDEATALPSATHERPAAVDGTLPDEPSVSLQRKAACTDKQCKLDGWLPDAAFAKSVPGAEPSPAALWSHELAAGSTLALPRHHALEVLAVVLRGSVLALGDDGGGGRKLGKWHALRAQGGGISLKADPGGAQLVMAVGSAKTTLAEALDHAKTKPWEVRWKKRPSPIASVDLKDAKNLSWGDGAFHARIAFGGEYEVPASLGTLISSPDAHIPEHDHPTWEHIAILEGSGKMQLAGADHRVSAGAVFHIPKGVKHAFTPSGSSRLVAVQIYTPSGPEQRFVKQASQAKAAEKTPAAPTQPSSPDKPAGTK